MFASCNVGCEVLVGQQAVQVLPHEFEQLFVFIATIIPRNKLLQNYENVKKSTTFPLHYCMTCAAVMEGCFSTSSTTQDTAAVAAITMPDVKNSTTTSDDPNDSNACTAVNAKKTTKSAGSRKRKNSGVSKPVARPHKRLDVNILNARVLDMQKKKSLLQSKLVLLEARLETHVLEQNMRVPASQEM